MGLTSMLTDTADAIREKTGTTGKIALSQFPALIRSIPSGGSGGSGGSFDGEIVTWADGTWDQIKAMLDAHYAGQIDIHDYWNVGDTRTVSLSAMAATELTCTAGSMTSEAHVAQDVEMVLMSADHYDMSDGSGKAAFVFGTKDVLANGTTSEQGKMNNSNVTTGGWDGCARRAWCNSVFKAALPSDFQALLKQVDIVTADAGKSASTTTSSDYIFLAAEKEVFGSTTYANSTAETSLKQYTWYATEANRIKKKGPNGSTYSWWERSPYRSYPEPFCVVASSGAASNAGASSNLGVAPCGCI